MLNTQDNAKNNFEEAWATCLPQKRLAHHAAHLRLLVRKSPLFSYDSPAGNELNFLAASDAASSLKQKHRERLYVTPLHITPEGKMPIRLIPRYPGLLKLPDVCKQSVYIPQPFSLRYRVSTIYAAP
jgi:hypothetical protein